jgi:hypothetical protein
VVASVLLLALTLAGCHAAKATPATSAAVFCADAASFKSSLEALKGIHIQTVGLGGVPEALDTVRSNADALKASAGTLVASAVDAFDRSVDALKATVTGLTGSTAPGVAPSGIPASIATLVTSGKAIVQMTKPSCP